MIVGSQGAPIGEDKSLGVEEEIANVEIGMNTKQYEPIDRGIECTSESKDNNYSIEEDKGGISKPWREVDEEGKRINSIDFSFSSAINLITELDIVTGLQLTYDGKMKVMDVLNFMENGGLVAPRVKKVEIDFYMWGEVSLMVSSSGKNLFPGDNVQLKRAHEGHQDKGLLTSQGSTLPLEALYKIIQTVDQSIPWSFLLAILALANFEKLEKGERNIVASLKEKVMKRRYGIKDVFLPCDLLRDILTGREHLHCSGRLTHFKGAILRQILEKFLKDSNLFCGEAVDKPFGKHGRYIRRRLNVATLLVPKTADRKFFDIELKDIALCWFSPGCMTLLSMNFGSIISHGRGYP
ncbi:hypothetical protein FXO38_02721 [Capsicum annuum]|uniref:Uncharacterized protein n=1 Tax=Capsicum annuum TaxID=4072 RepID=A0A2G2ZMU3_CAPAN|nr:hypothetical protein FXO37_10834 [Capsicum annuum]KAF3679515.1 hypothetical protein FXO38_02721 [Capsicum annuum]PHT83293.1 hypothetical protein T459_11736 [Capsicum annuum]